MKEIKVTRSFPILSILGLIFITLKLAGIGVVASWSWWWVLLPFWIIPAIILALFAFAGILYLIEAKLEK